MSTEPTSPGPTEGEEVQTDTPTPDTGEADNEQGASEDDGA